MITTTADGKTFVLAAQTAQDLELIHALDMHGMHLRFTGIGRTPVQAAGFISTSATVQIDPNSAESLRADTGREVVRAFSQLIRLGLREAALHGHVGANAANPQAQEQLATILEQLQLMLKTLGDTILQQEAVFQKMQCTHGDASEVIRASIVAEGGAA